MTIVRVKSDYDIFVGEYPFHKQLYDELVSTLEEYPDKQDRNTNVKATMTEWNWDPISDRLKRLKNCVIQDAKSKFFQHAGYLYEHPLAFFESFWGNVYHKGDCAVTHHHLYSHLSMVYFLKTKWYHSPLVFTYSGKKIRPRGGRYVLFPSHIMHHVPIHRFKETRITLSGNIILKEEI